jgi:hypothetical protein
MLLLSILLLRVEHREWIIPGNDDRRIYCWKDSFSSCNIYCQQEPWQTRPTYTWIYVSDPSELATVSLSLVVLDDLAFVPPDCWRSDRGFCIENHTGTAGYAAAAAHHDPGHLID